MAKVKNFLFYANVPLCQRKKIFSYSQTNLKAINANCQMHEQKEEIPSQALDCLEQSSNLNNLLSFVKNNREKDI